MASTTARIRSGAVRDQVRCGEFDDTPDAAGSEVVMDDEQISQLAAMSHSGNEEANLFELQRDFV